MMRIAIFGQAKSGTSAIFAKLREALPANTDCYFEPRIKQVWRYRHLRLLETLGVRQRRPLLAKFLPFYAGDNKYIATFGSFDHAIQIVRDPRDRLISALLYWSYNSSLYSDSSSASAFIERIAAKERDPKSIGLSDLIADFLKLSSASVSFEQWLVGYSARAIHEPLAFAEAKPDLIDFRYESMVDHEFRQLNAAIGMTLNGEANVGLGLQRVVRSKGYGDWRNWFTESDVDLLQPVLQPYLDRYYPQASWHLSANPIINPAHGSHYVRRVINEARANAGLTLLPDGLQ
jgi:hypothetical protein